MATYDKEKELPAELVDAIKGLVDAFEKEDREVRIAEIRKVQKARDMWKGLHYQWWDQAQSRWRPPNEAPGYDPAMMPRFQYVVNIYQAYGNTIISVLGQNVPKVAWFPQDPNQEQDVLTARAAQRAGKYIQRNVDPRAIITDIASYFWTDGACGVYVRYLADAEQFGTEDIPIMEPQPQKMTPDMAVCETCGYEGEFGESICPNCGSRMTDVLGETVDVPVQTGVEQVPKGQEQITVVGKLELKTPMWTSEQKEFPYLIWSREIHRARLRSMFKEKADKIQGGVSGLGELNQEERVARLEASSGAGSMDNGQPTRIPGLSGKDEALVTFRQVWFRPWAFWALEDKKVRDQLLQQFPNGAYCAFAGDVYLEARPEAMDDHWRIGHANLGDGQNRPALGEALIPIQEIFNDLINIHTETYERGLPAKWVNTRYVDAEKAKDQISLPGAMYGIQGPTGRPMSDLFYEESKASVSGDMMQFMGDLMGGISQFIVGAFPALFGGEMEQETASGYAMARDQAMGRVGQPWRRIITLFTEAMALAVEEFKKNRRLDVSMEELGDDGEKAVETISMADLKGRFKAYPEADENFPLMQAQIRASINAMLQNNNPIMVKLLAHPANQQLLKQTVGTDDLVVPDQDVRSKQLAEIELLLQAAPVAAMDPMTGTQTMNPTVPIGLLDYHEVELETVRMWMVSPKGQEARATNPEGFANVEAHGMAHYQIIQGLMAQQAVQAAGAAEVGADGSEQPQGAGGKE